MSDYEVSGKMSLDITPFIRELERAEQRLGAVTDKITKLEGAIDRLSGKTAVIKVDVDALSAYKKLDDIEAQIRSMHDKTIRLTTDEVQHTTQTDDRVDRVTESLLPFDHATGVGSSPAWQKIQEDAWAQDQTAKVDVVVAGEEEAKAKLESVDSAARKVDGKEVKLKVKVDDSEAKDKLNKPGGGGGDSTFGMMPALIGAGMALSAPVLGAAIGALAGLVGMAATGMVGAVAAAVGLKEAYGEVNTAATALASAQTAVDKATSEASLGKALEQESRAFADMTPQMNSAVGSLNAFKSAAKDLGSGYLDTLNHGLQVGTQLLGQFAPVSASAKTGLDGVIASLSARIDTGQFSAFFDYMKNNVAGFVNQFGNAVLNFVTGIGNMIVAFDPFTKQMSNGLQSMSEKFLAWSQQLSGNSGFHSFVDYVTTNGPKVYQALHQIVVDIIDLVTSLAPLGGGALSQLRVLLDLLDTLSKIPGFAAIATLGFLVYQMSGPLGSLVTGFRGLTTGLGAAEGAAGSAGSKLGLLGSLMAGTNEKWNSFSINTGVATEKITGSANAGEKAMTAMGGLGKAIGAVGTALPFVGIGVALISDQVDSYNQKIADATAQADKWVYAQSQGGQAAVDGAAHIDTLKGKIADLTARQNELNKAAAGGARTSGGGEISTQLHEYTTELNTAVQTEKDRQASLTETQKRSEAVTKATNDLDLAMQGKGTLSMAQAMDKYQAAAKNAADGAYNLAQAQMSVADKALFATSQLLGNESATLGLAKAEDSVASSADAYNKVMDNSKSTLAQRNAAEIALRESMLSAASAADAKSRAENASLPPAQQNILASRAQYDEYVKLEKQMGKNVPDAIKTLIEGLAKSTSGANFAQVAFDNVGKSVTKIPGTKDVLITAPTAGAEAQLTALGFKVTHMPDGSIRVSANTKFAQDAIDAEVADINRRLAFIQVYATSHIASGTMGGITRATGGYVSGPGTRTSDSIPAWLSNGEYVLNADAVSRLGVSYLDQLNGAAARQSASSSVPGFAVGGPVNIPAGAIRGGDGGQALQARGSASSAPTVAIGQVVMAPGTDGNDFARDLAWTLNHGLTSTSPER